MARIVRESEGYGKSIPAIACGLTAVQESAARGGNIWTHQTVTAMLPREAQAPAALSN